MSKIPNKKECLKLLKDAGCSKEVIKHCRVVTGLALKIASLCNADVKLVNAGGMLHDIGRSKTHGVRHAIDGANIARGLGLSESIVNIIERHIGAGLTIKDAASLNLPQKEYIPLTLEEKIVSHADNLIATNHKQSVNELAEKWRKKGLHEAVNRLMTLHKELSDLCGVDIDTIDP